MIISSIPAFLTRLGQGLWPFPMASPVSIKCQGHSRCSVSVSHVDVGKFSTPPGPWWWMNASNPLGNRHFLKICWWQTTLIIKEDEFRCIFRDRTVFSVFSQSINPLCWLWKCRVWCSRKSFAFVYLDQVAYQLFLHSQAKSPLHSSRSISPRSLPPIFTSYFHSPETLWSPRKVLLTWRSSPLILKAANCFMFSDFHHHFYPKSSLELQP